MSSPRAADRVLLVWALLVALLLHLPAHVGFAGGAAGREALHEDGPVLSSNPALEVFGSESLRDVIVRAATDPSAAWAEGDGSVGRAQFRPVSQAAFAVEHHVFRSRVLPAAAVVSLALHLAVVALTLAMLARLDAPRAARWLAGTVVAAAPAALSVAAWPARQAVVLAAACALAAAVLALRGGFLRSAGAAVLLAAAALSHELGFGLGLAALVVAAARRGPGGAAVRPWGPAAGLAAAATVRLWVLAAAPAPAAAAGAGPGPLDGLAGMVQAALAIAVPARLHFADGPWLATGLARAACAVAVAAAGAALVRARGPSAVLGRAAGAALLPVAAMGVVGSAVGAPCTDGLVYAATPFAASAAAWVVAAALARGGGIRIAAAAAGALWIGAHVAGTAVRAPQFRTRAGHLALAEREMPSSPVVEAWALHAATGEAERAGDAAGDSIRALAARAERLGRTVASPGAASFGRDPVAAVTLSSALCRAALAVAARSGDVATDEACESAAEAAAAATRLMPGWTRPWIVLATVHETYGALQPAYEATSHAARLAPQDVEVMVTGVRAALALGRITEAAAVAEGLLDSERESARAAGRAERAEVHLLAAAAFAADGTTRVPDPLGGDGVRFRFEVAIVLLRGLLARGEAVPDASRNLYRTCLRYGDTLASIDRPALALLAYREAAGANVADSEAEEHRGWLVERLKKEEADASAAVQRALRGEGNAADALVRYATALCRQGRWEDASQVFDEIERQQGMSPALRFHRALGLWRDADPRRAIAELRTAVREDPRMAVGHHELARLLEEDGAYEDAIAAYAEARRLAAEGAATAGAEDWILDADDRIEAIRAILRDPARSR